MQRSVRDNIERALVFLPMALILVGIAAVGRLYIINDWTWAGVNTLLPYALFAGMLLGVFPTVAGLVVAIWRYSTGKSLVRAAVFATVVVWALQYAIMLIVDGISPGLPDLFYLAANVLNTVLFTEMIAPHQSRFSFGRMQLKRTGAKR